MVSFWLSGRQVVQVFLFLMLCVSASLCFGGTGEILAELAGQKWSQDQSARIRSLPCFSLWVYYLSMVCFPKPGLRVCAWVHGSFCTKVFLFDRLTYQAQRRLRLQEQAQRRALLKKTRLDQLLRSRRLLNFEGDPRHWVNPSDPACLPPSPGHTHTHTHTPTFVKLGGHLLPLAKLTSEAGEEVLLPNGFQ